MFLWDNAAYAKEYQFYFECKRLKYNLKNKAYIECGLKRYLTCFYAPKMPFAAMVGYVEAGNIENIVNDINERLRLTTSHSLISPIEHDFMSTHRKDCDMEINISHMFLDFRDANSRIGDEEFSVLHP